MPDDIRNNGLHPRHPGRGQPTSMLPLEGDEPAQGGVILFFPSGHHQVSGWQSVIPIYPIEGTAMQYSATIVEKLVEQAEKCMARGDAATAAAIRSDVNRTNWNSVAAGIAHIIREFNARLTTAVAAKLVAERGEAGPGAEVVPYH